MVKTLGNYESMHAELELIIEQLQSGELNLDEAVKKYDRGIQLIAKLEEYLKLAQNNILKIKASLK